MCGQGGRGGRRRIPRRERTRPTSLPAQRMQHGDGFGARAAHVYKPVVGPKEVEDAAQVREHLRADGVSLDEWQSFFGVRLATVCQSIRSASAGTSLAVLFVEVVLLYGDGCLCIGQPRRGQNPIGKSCPA